MSWLRKKMAPQSDDIASKFSSSTKNKSIIHTEPTTGTIQNIAKILIIGETGSGKSTFINYLTNYFLGGNYDNPRIAIPTRYYKITESLGHYEMAIDDVTVSKTTACHQYLFHDSKTNKQYLFLDTPGLGDTRGVRQDETNIETILNAINSLQGLTSVVIVVNGSMARITTNFRSVLSALRGNLPDIVLDNVILILSHVKRHQSTFDIKKTLKMNGTHVYPYYMQNSAFAQDPTSWGSHEHKHIERDWIESMEEIQQMLCTINTFQTKSVAAFDDMRTIRNAIKTCMHDARLEIIKVQRMHDDILVYEQAVKKFKGEEFSYKDYTQEQTIIVNELIDAPNHSTICTVCDLVCHQGCSLEETEEIGNQIFQQCAAMDGSNNCKRCPDSCSFSVHYHARKMMKTSEQKVTTVLHDIKAKFDIATKNKSDFEQKLNSTQDARKLMEQVLRQKIDAVQVQCRELRKVCGNFNLAQELHTFVEQLRIEAQTLTSLEARHQAEMFIRELNTFCQNFEAQEQNTTTSKSDMIVVDTGSGSDKTTAKFNSSTRNQEQELNEKVTAVQRLLEAQLKKKKAPMATKNPNDSVIYESIDDGDQEEPQRQNSRPVPSNQWKSDNQSQQSSKIPKRPLIKSSSSHDVHTLPTMATSDNQYRQTHSVKPSASKSTKVKYELLTVKELVDELHTAIAQNRSKSAIDRELRKRAQGISCPMITPSDRTMFTRYTNKYSHMNSREIRYQYMRLQKYVNSQLGDDSMNIENITTIPSKLLVELAALYTLLSSKGSATSESDIEEHEYDDYKRLSPPSTSRTARPRQSDDFEFDDGRSECSTYSTTTQQSSYFEPARQDVDNRRTRSGRCTGERMNAPPSYDDAIGRRNEPLSQTRSSSTIRSEQYQTRERQRDNPRPSNRKPPVSYDARSNVDDDKNRYRTNAKADFATMTTDKLVDLYSHAPKLEDVDQQTAIYTQLKKRCDGEDNRLMNDPMMKQILDRYQLLETTTLEDKLDAIKKEIRKLTNGGDATLIKNIPRDLLIRITAINSILCDRSSEDSYF